MKWKKKSPLISNFISAYNLNPYALLNVGTSLALKLEWFNIRFIPCDIVKVMKKMTLTATWRRLCGTTRTGEHGNAGIKKRGSGVSSVTSVGRPSANHRPAVSIYAFLHHDASLVKTTRHHLIARARLHVQPIPVQKVQVQRVPLSVRKAGLDYWNILFRRRFATAIVGK